MSLCCARCRKRRTPPSVRFLGRRVYLAAVVVLACVLRQGPTRWRVARLRDLPIHVITLTTAPGGAFGRVRSSHIVKGLQHR